MYFASSIKCDGYFITSTYCIEVLPLIVYRYCRCVRCVPVCLLCEWSCLVKSTKMCRFLYNALFSLCHVSKCEMIIYVYTDAFIRSHESNQVALLITALLRHGIVTLAVFHVFGGSVCCLFDNLRCSRCGEVVNVDGPLCFTDCHIIYNQFIVTRVPVIAVQP